MQDPRLNDPAHCRAEERKHRDALKTCAPDAARWNALQASWFRDRAAFLEQTRKNSEVAE